MFLKEVQFIKDNEAKWETFAKRIEEFNKNNPDELADLYIEISDDLSFARTFYSSSKIVPYLNQLALKAHQKIYANKKEKKSRFITFWTTEIPLAVFRSRRALLYSFITFMVAIAIGAFSSSQDAEYVRLILGDSYVNMTEYNIENDDPMAVYDSMAEGVTFALIAYNNIRVSFLAYIAGILTSIMTGIILFTNGIMVGAFIYMFYEKGLLWLSFSTIMLHGTLELAAIVIAGAAGYVLGSSFLFPGTYSRTVSLIAGAKRSLKIIIGLFPVFVVAALIEGFVTRHYLELGSLGRWSIVALSALFIIWYFILYPIQIGKQHEREDSI